MIGEARLTYQNNDLAQLVRKDLIDKFGNRELACYNLYMPGVITPKAKVVDVPVPDVKVTSVADRIAALIPSRPTIPRSEGTITLDPLVGGSAISLAFDRESNTVTITGGPVKWDSYEAMETQAHWVCINVGFPLGWSGTKNQIIAYSLNGSPNYFKLSQEDIDNGYVSFFLDASLTTYEFAVNWAEEYEPEKIHVVVEASLQDSAIKKVPAFPSEPLVELSYPTSEVYAESVIQIDVDLELGRQ